MADTTTFLAIGGLGLTLLFHHYLWWKQLKYNRCMKAFLAELERSRNDPDRV